MSIAAAAACGGGSSDGGVTTPTPTPTPTPPVATTAVSLRNNAFTPVDIVVPASATVTFTNSDGIAHNVTFASNSISSVPNWSTGDRTVAMPAAAGTYPFTCTIHAGMNGSVKVQ